MTEKITIHRALTELKTLDDRIHSAIVEGVYITPNKRSNEKINGKTIEDHKKIIQSSYDKVAGLIARRNLIKTAIVDSNAKTLVTVAGVEMTVAQAIERKASIAYEEHFLDQMKANYVSSVARVNKENDTLPHKLETYLQSILGNKENAKKEDVEYHTKSFMNRNEFELIDPLDLAAKIAEYEDAINNFRTDVDSVLSESNAVTFIFDDQDKID